MLVELTTDFPPIEDEKMTTSFVITLSVCLPLAFAILPFIQYKLYMCYQSFGHPWSNIFNLEKENEFKENGKGQVHHQE